MLGYRTKNFAEIDFHCKCNCGEVAKLELVNTLQEVREALGAPLYVNSTMRCVDHNEFVGGSKKSYHIRGLAVDLSTRNLSEGQIIALKEIAVEHGFLGLGFYDHFIHLDLRNELTIWDKRNK